MEFFQLPLCDTMQGGEKKWGEKRDSRGDESRRLQRLGEKKEVKSTEGFSSRMEAVARFGTKREAPP